MSTPYVVLWRYDEDRDACHISDVAVDAVPEPFAEPARARSNTRPLTYAEQFTLGRTPTLRIPRALLESLRDDCRNDTREWGK